MGSFSEKITAIASKMSSNKYLSAIRDAFVTNMPIVITGSFAVLFGSVICSPTTGLAQFPAFAFLAQFVDLFTPVNYATMNVMALTVCFLIGAHIGRSNGMKPLFTGSLALSSYFVFVPTFVNQAVKAAATPELSADITVKVSNVLGKAETDAQGLFLAIIIGILSVEIYSWLMKNKALQVKMPDSVPPNISESFSALFPAMITLFGLGALSYVFIKLTGLHLSTAIFKMIQQPLQVVMEFPIGILVIVLVAQVLWTLGLHGASITSAIRQPILLASVAANLDAVQNGLEAPYIVSSPFWPIYCTIGGSGATFGLLIAIFIASKREDYRAIAKLSVPPGLFNINEPVIFGIPIVLNPIMMIPFILAPLTSASIGYFLTAIGFAGKLYIEVPWTTPPLLNSYLASGGNIGTVLAQLIAIAATVVIFFPFVIMANKQLEKEQAAASVVVE